MKLKLWLSAVLLTGALIGTAGADVYVKNKLFEGQVSGSGSSTLVEARAMLEALGVEGFEMQGNTLVINDQTLALDGGLVSLKALSEAIGAKVLINPELGTIDVYQDPGKQVAAAPTSSVSGSPSDEVKGYAPAAMQKGVWLTDWEAAKAQAQRSNKPILINFTGSDWCGWCIRLKKEVFSQEAFQSWAGQNVVLFEADFPRRTPLPPALKAQNEQLAQQFQITGYPSIIFANGNGKQLGQRYGYQEGGPAAWIKGAEQCMGR